MAKSKSIIRLQGTFAGMTFVNSKAYGPHVRAPRGTHKKAVVNSAFEEGSARLQSGNVPARLILYAIKPFRVKLSHGQFWQNLVSMYSKKFKGNGKFDFANIEPIEIHDRHTFNRFLSIRSTIKSNRKKNTLDIHIHYDAHPKFKGSRYTDGYRVRVIGIFPDLKKKRAHTMVTDSKVIGLTGTVSPLALRLTIPPNANRYVICLKIDGCTKGVVNRMLTTQGMKIICGGKIQADR